MNKKAYQYQLLRRFCNLSLALCFLFSAVMAKNVFDWRIVLRPSESISNAERLSELEAFMAEIKKHDYNAITLGGSSMARMYKFGAAEKARFHQMIAKAEQLGITIIPLTDGQKCPKRLDDRFREGFANKETPFVVSGNTAGVDLPPVSIGDPGLEEPIGTVWKGGDFKLDLTEKKSGKASYRIDSPTKGSGFRQTITVAPYRTYKLTMYVKLSKDVDWYQNVGFTVKGGSLNLLKKRDGGRNRITRGNLGGPWFLHTDEFNSRQHSNVELRISVAENSGSNGSMWFDEIKVQEVGLYNTVRRNTLPLVVKSADGKTIYSEGQDYVVGTEKLDIPAGSSIPLGGKLSVDWYTLATPNTSKPPIAFCDSEVWDSVRTNVALTDTWFKTPPARLMAYSEWRVAGWDPVCIRDFEIDKLGSGPYFGHVARMTESIYREANSNREALIYNDDYDPYHNAKGVKGSVNGGALGSWNGLTEKTIVVNWCASKGKKKASLAFFAGLDKTNWPGFGVKTSHQRQIISAGRWGTGIWGEWHAAMEELEKNEGMSDTSVIGVQFHTYVPDYANIGAMADYYKSVGRWGSGPINFKPASIESRAQPKRVAVASLSVGRATNSKTRIRFEIPETGFAKLLVYNSQGQRVARLLNERMAKGAYERSLETSKLSPGVYFVRLTAGTEGAQMMTRKALVF